MKAEELMVGDWVYCEGQPTPDNVTIETIAEDGVWFNGPHYEGAASYDRIFPIPLTPEILEKNYSSTPEWYFDGTNKYCLRISRYKDKWNFYYGRGSNGVQIQINIQYVHELQHALRLCGIDKTIEL